MQTRPLAGLGLAIPLLLLAMAAPAQYHSYNVVSGSDCIVQTYRSPNLPAGIYDAIHQETVSSADGGSGYFYGGFTHHNNVGGDLKTLVQYVCWPASGGYPFSYAQQIPVFAGTNMVGFAQIGEGSSCAIKGYWPEFDSSQFIREAVRYWQPAHGPAHVGFQGMWIKEPVSGNWYHVGTFQYPFAVTGVHGMSGWQENFTGYTGDFIVDHAGGYYHFNGAWSRANQIHFTGGGNTSFCELIDGNTAARSSCGPSYPNNVPITLTLSGQPVVPGFDPILVSNAMATVYGSQLLVQWRVPLNSSPQLGYLIEVFTNASYTGNVALTYYNNDPDNRQQLLTLTNVATPFVRLTISDIFFNTNAPISLTPAPVPLAPATNVPGTVAGLNYDYYQSAAGNWTALPDFAGLTPTRRGAVGFPDVSPRLRRSNYGFNFTGFFNAPGDGIYTFTLHSGDGSVLEIDGQPVVNFDGLHDSSQFQSGGCALAAGLHQFKLRFFKGAANPVNPTAYTDGLGLAYEGPDIPLTDVPASAFARVPGANEPTITMTAPTANATVLNANPGFTAAVNANGATLGAVQYFLTDYYSYYPRPAAGADYFLGQVGSAPFALNSLVWAAPTNLVRARLIYNGTNTIDSAPIPLATTNGAFGAWNWVPLEMHNYPSGAAVQNGTFHLLGDGMNLITRQVTGDCTFVAHVANLTANVAGPDGILPDDSWRAGIILRGTTNTTIGQPLGDGSGTRFTALFSAVAGGTYFEDDTMRNGNGDANAWSSNLGGGNRWFKLQRVGNTFYSSVSADGATWNLVHSNTLVNFGATIHAGVFIHAVQSMNPNLHRASFDGFSLTGAGVVGPGSVHISPLTNSVIGGLAATFSAAVVGSVPAGYQWQFNGVNLPDATNATLTLPNVATNHAGLYTVVANSVTSAPAMLLISAPAGSGVWTNRNGGSWNLNTNWSAGAIAGGVDSLADFSTLNLSVSPTVTLDGARTNGTLLCDDQNPVTKHNWILSSGSGGSLTLATSSGTPAIAVNYGTCTLMAPVAGTQGFNKTGAGALTLTAASPITGTINVNAGTVEVQNKSGDTPYSVAAGATLKIGYNTGGGYANTGLNINGSGAAATNGFYLLGGRTYNVSGGLNLNGAPTRIRGYGAGLASFGIFDINSVGLWCTAASSGSVVETNVQFVNGGYGMALRVDAGTNNAAGDLSMNGPLNINNNLFAGGLIKRGAGSLRLNAPAANGNSGLSLREGSVLCGAANCVGANALLELQAGTTFDLMGTTQTVAGASLAGTLRLNINKDNAAASGKLIVSGGTLALGGDLVISNASTSTLGAGDTFTVLAAPGYSGAFSSVTAVPTLPVGLSWDTSNLSVNGSITVTSNATSSWNGGGANNNWNTAANWNGPVPTNGQSLLFQGALRLVNTNNLLSSAGQIIFGNGSFTIRGNPLSLLWGVWNQSGNNTWSIGTTLAASQSFFSSNGTLAVSAAVANAGHDLTLDGPGAITLGAAVSGAGRLIKNGSGTGTISAQQTFSGGTTINAGALNLVGGGGASGPIRGAVTVNAGGTLQINTGDGFGYNADSTVINPLNIVGGTVNVVSTANQTLGNATINLTGGLLTGAASGNLDFFQGGSTVNTFAATNTAVISGVPLSPLRQGSTTFTVAAGTTPGGIDLDIFSVLRASPSGDAVGATFYKAGAGVLRLNATNTFAKPVVVSAGTLLVNGSLMPGSPVTVASGARLGGTGILRGAVTVQSGGALLPGNFGIGTLTAASSLSLGGTTVMEISRISGVWTNDLVTVTGVLTESGALVVTNSGGFSPGAGDTFKLFNAGTFAGGFTNLTLPALPGGMFWDSSKLIVNGTLSVAAAAPGFTGGNFQTGSGFSLSATGAPGAVCVLQGATNLSAPVDWLSLLTNTADSQGQLNFTDAAATNLSQRYYRMLVP